MSVTFESLHTLYGPQLKMSADSGPADQSHFWVPHCRCCLSGQACLHHIIVLLQLTSSSSPLLTTSTSLPSVKLATSLSHLRHLKILVENIPCFQHTEKGKYCELHNILPELALVSQLKKSSLLQSRVATPGGNMTWYWAEAQIFELLPYVQVILIFEAILFTWVLNSSFSAPCRVRPHSLSNPQGVHSQTSAGHCRSHKCCTMHMLLSSLMLCRQNLEDDTDWGGSLQLVAVHPERPLLCNALQWVTMECLKQKSPSRLTTHQSPSSSPLTSYLQFEGAF